MGKAKWFVLAAAAAAVSVALICGEAARQREVTAFVPYAQQAEVKIRALNVQESQILLTKWVGEAEEGTCCADLVIENNQCDTIRVSILRASIAGVTADCNPQELCIEPGAREIASLTFTDIPENGGTLTCLLDAIYEDSGKTILYSALASLES